MTRRPRPSVNVAPDAAVVYADELLHGNAEGTVRCVEADARGPEEVLA